MSSADIPDSPPQRKYTTYREATLSGHPCPTCGVSRLYVSARNAERSAGKDCKSCANSKSGGGTGMAYDAEGRKLCNDCREQPAAHNSLCQGCSSSRLMKNYFQKYRYTKYGVTKEWFDERFKGACEICDTSITREAVHLDHNHSTNKARGLLCGLCNKGLGQFKDSIDTLKAAVTYLEKTQCK